MADAAFWASANISRAFAEQRDELAALCSEVESTLRLIARKSKTEVAHTAARVKSLRSILDKVERKGYGKLDDVTDLAAARIVCLYRDDVERLAVEIRKHFLVVEEVDKREANVDQFGYGAMHFLVKLSPDCAGVRYEQLKGRVCEIQLRTALQDAWAVLDHHLRYKRESSVPTAMRRGIHMLAAGLESADIQFNSIRSERDAYFARLSSRRTSLEMLLDEEVNKESVSAYLKRKFPKLTIEAYHGHLDVVMANIDARRYASLRKIDEAVDATRTVRGTYRDPRVCYSAANLGLALACVDHRYRAATSMSLQAKSVMRRFDKRKQSHSKISSNDSRSYSGRATRRRLSPAGRKR